MKRPYDPTNPDNLEAFDEFCPAGSPERRQYEIWKAQQIREGKMKSDVRLQAEFEHETHEAYARLKAEGKI
jgi:hypothetical protein